jgi:hypothetical protein
MKSAAVTPVVLAFSSETPFFAHFSGGGSRQRLRPARRAEG